MTKKEFIPEIGEVEISDYTPNQDEIDKILEFEKQAELDIPKWGGCRKGAGRKPLNGNVLKFQVRVSEKEKEFLKYARSHHINYDDLMQG